MLSAFIFSYLQWLKCNYTCRLVRTVDEKFKNICPKHWQISQRLCLSFHERTKLHVVAMLTDNENQVRLLCRTF